MHQLIKLLSTKKFLFKIICIFNILSFLVLFYKIMTHEFYMVIDFKGMKSRCDFLFLVSYGCLVKVKVTSKGLVQGHILQAIWASCKAQLVFILV